MFHASATKLSGNTTIRQSLLKTQFAAIAIVFALALRVCADSGAHEPIDFARDIRPILSDRCFICHGPDGEQRQADLRLDEPAGMFAELAHGAGTHIVKPGQPEESELYRRISSPDDDLRMPPADAHLPLSQAEIELIRRWITSGAKYSEHWAFQPLAANASLPAVHDETWPRGAIDRFVLAQLDEQSLVPSPPATPLAWLRRATLDLTGLPSTVDEIRDFEHAWARDGGRAKEAVVARLLSSTAYGEHMAVAWLDAARYADSFGYQSDQLNTQWPYRDWVVRAFNENLPYDQFVTWQLAGDLLESPSRDQILATAFNRLHRLTNEGGSLAEEWLVENAADRVHTFGTVFLGLTMECSRCHDHKYDPITMGDYYSLAAFFNSIDERGMYDHSVKVPSPTLLLPDEAQQAQLAARHSVVDEATEKLRQVRVSGDRRFAVWMKEQGETPDMNDPVDLIGYYSFDGGPHEISNQTTDSKHRGETKSLPEKLTEVAGVRRGLAVQFNGDDGIEIRNLIQIDRWTPFTIDFWIRDEAQNPQPVVVLHQTFGTDVGYNGFDLLLEDGCLIARIFRDWPGNGIGIRAKQPLHGGRWQQVAITYDGSSTADGLRMYFGGRPAASDIVRDHIVKRAFVRTYGEGHFTLGARFRDRGFAGGAIDELRVFRRALTEPEIAVLAKIEMDRESYDQQMLREYYFSAVDRPTRDAAARLQEARRRLVEAEDEIHEVSVMRELPEPRPTYVLARGAYDAPKSDEDLVDRNTFVDFLMPFPADAPRDRLGLAQWLADPQHPLTARVFVNRLWANFFGQGLVETSENFGRQGAWPSHPELLDWLARDFVDHGWDIKRLCRQIVLSSTYGQDSALRQELLASDPQNRLLARGPSHRLSAEQVRDVALAAAGLLEPTAGGPPVSPYQPGEDLWKESNSMSPPYRQSTGKALYRRSLYSVWKRTAPLPNMMAFDAISREVCTVARSRTNTPQQALVLLNDVQFVEAARVMATGLLQEFDDDRSRLDAAWLRTTGREPDAKELAILSVALDQQRQLFAHCDPGAAQEYVSVGEHALAQDIDAVELAALTATCQIILNLDATVWKR